LLCHETNYYNYINNVQGYPIQIMWLRKITKYKAVYNKKNSLCNIDTGSRHTIKCFS